MSLNNVRITNPSNGQFLAYNTTTSNWENSSTMPDNLVVEGTLDMEGDPIINVQDPTDDQDAATKAYCDDKLPLAGGTMTGNIEMNQRSITNVGGITGYSSFPGWSLLSNDETDLFISAGNDDIHIRPNTGSGANEVYMTTTSFTYKNNVGTTVFTLDGATNGDFTLSPGGTGKVVIKNPEWTEASGPIPINSDPTQSIYLSTVSGNDTNNGLTSGTAVATWDRAVDLANGYDNPTIEILSDSGDVSISAGSYRARGKITVSGATTTDLDTTVQSATVQTTYEIYTTITVSDTLTASALVGKTLNFTSGSFSGQSFAIIDNGVNDITIAGNAGASASDTFTVSTPSEALKILGNVYLQGIWVFSNLELEDTSESDIITTDCNACVKYLGCQIAASLDSKKSSLTEIEACYQTDSINTVFLTTGFSGAWWIRNTMFDNSIQLTFEFAEVKFENVWFENNVIVPHRSQMTFNNCHLEGQNITIENQSTVNFNDFFLNYTEGSTRMMSVDSLSTVIFSGNVRLQGNATSIGIFLDAEAKVNVESADLIIDIDTAGSPDFPIQITQGSTFNNQNGNITFIGDYGNGIRLDDISEFYTDGGSLDISGGTYSSSLVNIQGQSSGRWVNTTITATGSTIARYFECDNNSNAYVNNVDLTVATATNGFYCSGGELFVGGNVSITSSSICLVAGVSARINLVDVNGTWTSSGNDCMDITQSQLWIDSTGGGGLTLTGSSTDIDLNVDAQMKCDGTNLTLTNGVVIGNLAIQALPSSGTYTLDIASGASVSTGGAVGNAGFTISSGDLDMNSNSIVNVADPSSAQDAATKNYVDASTTTYNNIISTAGDWDFTTADCTVISTPNQTRYVWNLVFDSGTDSLANNSTYTFTIANSNAISGRDIHCYATGYNGTTYFPLSVWINAEVAVYDISIRTGDSWGANTLTGGRLQIEWTDI